MATGVFFTRTLLLKDYILLTLIKYRLLVVKIGSLEIKPKYVLCTFNWTAIGKPVLSNFTLRFVKWVILFCYLLNFVTALAKKLLKNTAVPSLNLVLEDLPKSTELPEPKTSQLPKPIEVFKMNEAPKSIDLPQKRLHRLLPKLCNTNVTCTEVSFSRPHYTQLQVPDESSSKTESCLVDWCQQYRESNQWNEPLSFHKFPSDDAKQQQWLQVISLSWYSFMFHSIQFCFQFSRLLDEMFTSCPRFGTLRQEFVLCILNKMIFMNLVKFLKILTNNLKID